MKLQTQNQIDIKCKIFNYCMENMGEYHKPKTKSEKTDLLNFLGSSFSATNFHERTGLIYDSVLMECKK